MKGSPWAAYSPGRSGWNKSMWTFIGCLWQGIVRKRSTWERIGYLEVGKKIQRVQIEGLESLTVSKLRTVRIKRAFSGKEPIKFFSWTLINSAYGKDRIKDMALPNVVSNELSVGTIKLEKEREEWSWENKEMHIANYDWERIWGMIIGTWNQMEANRSEI